MLTAEQVKKGATTPKKALELSIKHWWENYSLAKKQIRMGNYLSLTFANKCGLCAFYKHPYRNSNSNYDNGSRGCVRSGCIVRATCPSERSLYTKAEDALRVFVHHRTDKTYREWRKAAKAMHKYLCSLRGKELKER